MSDQKLTNPKDVIGNKKLPVHLVPDTLTILASLGFLEGALKYGQFNWRIAGVRMSVYLAAFERHRMKLVSGDWEDNVTRVPHIASMICCLAIIGDAWLSGMLNDDRPPRSPNMSAYIDSLSVQCAHLKELFKDHNPVQYTAVGLDNDARRQSESSGGQTAEVPFRVLPEASAIWHGIPSRGLPRVPPKPRVRNRSKGRRKTS